MIISKPIITINNYQSKITFKIESKNFNDSLWYEIDSKYEDFVSEQCDSALIALLIPCMQNKEEIQINGTISEELYSNLLKIQKILKIVIPSLNIIKIHIDTITSEKYTPNAIATGFSAGVDSFSTLYDYFYNCKNDKNKITHFTYHNVGSHGNDINAQDLFNTRYINLNKIASQLGEKGIPFIKINSNVDNFYNEPHLYFMQTHTMRNMSIPHLLSKGIMKYYYSSTFFYKDINISQYYDLSRVEPILLPLLSNNILKLQDSGTEYTRVEKTLNVSTLDDAKKCLDVCVKSDDGTNCSKCFKCMRTQFTLDLEGKLDDFKNVFNLKVYEKHKSNYIKSILKDDYPFNQEIIEFAKSKDYKFPFLPTIIGKVIIKLKKIKRTFKEF